MGWTFRGYTDSCSSSSCVDCWYINRRYPYPSTFSVSLRNTNHFTRPPPLTASDSLAVAQANRILPRCKIVENRSRSQSDWPMHQGSSAALDMEGLVNQLIRGDNTTTDGSLAAACSSAWNYQNLGWPFHRTLTAEVDSPTSDSPLDKELFDKIWRS